MKQKIGNLLTIKRNAEILQKIILQFLLTLTPLMSIINNKQLENLKSASNFAQVWAQVAVEKGSQIQFKIHWWHYFVPKIMNYQYFCLTKPIKFFNLAGSLALLIIYFIITSEIQWVSECLGVFGFLVILT